MKVEDTADNPYLHIDEIGTFWHTKAPSKSTPNPTKCDRLWPQSNVPTLESARALLTEFGSVPSLRHERESKNRQFQQRSEETSNRII
jgi:hypothetical protein